MSGGQNNVAPVIVRWSLPSFFRLGQFPVASLCPALYCRWKFLVCVLLALWATNRFSACFVLFLINSQGASRKQRAPPNQRTVYWGAKKLPGNSGVPQAVSTRSHCHPEALRGKERQSWVDKVLPRQPCCLPASAPGREFTAAVMEVWRERHEHQDKG